MRVLRCSPSIFAAGDDLARYRHRREEPRRPSLRERPEVAADSIGIAGASIGANLAVLDAADDPGVRSIALLSPGLDYRGLRIEAAMKKYGARPALLAGARRIRIPRDRSGS